MEGTKMTRQLFFRYWFAKGGNEAIELALELGITRANLTGGYGKYDDLLVYKMPSFALYGRLARFWRELGLGYVGNIGRLNDTRELWGLNTRE